jgi:hypothetical protein
VQITLRQPKSAKNANDELASESAKSLMRIIAATGLLGGGARLGFGALRSASPRYEMPGIPKPIVVDMPYPVATSPAGPIPVPGKERKMLGSIPATSIPKFAVELPDWAKAIPFGESIHEALPAYTPPLGKPGETNPSNVPALGAAKMIGGLGGLFGGYKLTDAVIRAADKRKAMSELDEAQKHYQDTMLQRLAESRLPAKAAADASPPMNMTEVRAALDALYEAKKATATKLSGDEIPSASATPIAPGDKPNAIHRTLASLLWPGLVGGPDAAMINAGLVGGMGALGGYAGYNYARDPDSQSQARKQIKAVDRANAEGLPSPIVARLVPVHRPNLG